MDHSEQSCEEWSSLSGFYTAEEADFMGQLLNNCQVPQHHYGNFNLEIPSTLWPIHDSTIVSINNSSHFPQNYDNNSNTDFLSFLQESNSISATSNISPTINCGNICLNDQVANIGYISMENAHFSTYSIQGNDSQQITENTDEEFGQEVSESTKEGTNNSLEKPGKRSRSSIKVEKNKRNVKSRKKPKSEFISNAEEDESTDVKEQNLSSEDDDFNASQKVNAGGSSILNQNDSTALKLKGKTRCDRGSGSASDPQGVYAKKRRERINERLKILQSLVPNGTKVDISTMLEEAVQYVKFLQVQIKLLSSDDHWMYAPIAYNGMNIGLNLDINYPNQTTIEHIRK